MASFKGRLTGIWTGNFPTGVPLGARFEWDFSYQGDSIDGTFMAVAVSKGSPFPGTQNWDNAPAGNITVKGGRVIDATLVWNFQIIGQPQTERFSIRVLNGSPTFAGWGTGSTVFCGPQKQLDSPRGLQAH
jgi:hypothetical protein